MTPVQGASTSCRTSSTPCPWQQPPNLANMQGMLEMKDSTFVAAAARQRHAPGGGPGLFVGRRVFLTVAPATSGGGRSSSTGSAGKVALVAQMVAAEGGTLVRALGQGEGGGGRGAASPSPSPEGATLLVCVAQGVNEARMGLRMGQVGVMRGSEGVAIAGTSTAAAAVHWPMLRPRQGRWMWHRAAGGNGTAGLAVPLWFCRC